ncbi:Txe/YoeB family addiction module toxin [Enterococcus hulanensis]|uniref:Txe/YoeB family addiction module toxin n=1 Tax=Enterococcus hulanensis TaxID=2559929 RepID=UPI00288C9005|nr:Txe/YoeB family addiction module toxin [Enterococcus hulanensis]MDT2660211.1 Txe/YoeB family addiction module toxin [Enterococcus hulanensis]
MSNYTARIKNSVKADLKKIKQFSLTAQFQKIVETLKDTPYLPTQAFEKLKPTQEGRYSRRLNRQHRVVYKVKEEERIVEIYSAWTHYEK